MVYNVLTPIDMKVFYVVMKMKGMDSLEMAKLYGIYSGQYTVLTNLPLAIAASVGIAYIPGISGAYARNDMQKTNKLLNQALSMSMLVTIPCAVGMGVLVLRCGSDGSQMYVSWIHIHSVLCTVNCNQQCASGHG